MKYYLIASFLLISVGISIACNTQCTTLTAYFEKCSSLFASKDAVNKSIIQNILVHLTTISQNVMNNIESRLNAIIGSATDVADLDKWCDRALDVVNVLSDYLEVFMEGCIASGDQQIIGQSKTIVRVIQKVLVSVHESCNGLDFDEFDEELQVKVQSLIEKCYDITVMIEASGLCSD